MNRHVYEVHGFWPEGLTQGPDARQVIRGGRPVTAFLEADSLIRAIALLQERYPGLVADRATLQPDCELIVDGGTL